MSFLKDQWLSLVKHNLKTKTFLWIIPRWSVKEKMKILLKIDVLKRWEYVRNCFQHIWTALIIKYHIYIYIYIYSGISLIYHKYQIYISMDYIIYIYVLSMVYYSALKKNEMIPFTTTWMALEIIILSEISQKRKGKYHMISLICGI